MALFNESPAFLHPTKRAHRVRADGSLDTRRVAVQNRIRCTITGTRSIDNSVHVTNRWLKELMEIMDWDNRERALSAYRAFLHALRDILPEFSQAILNILTSHVSYGEIMDVRNSLNRRMRNLIPLI